MRIGVLGTGWWAATLTTKFLDVGDEVVMVSRDASNGSSTAWAASTGGTDERGPLPTLPSSARSSSMPRQAGSLLPRCELAGADGSRREGSRRRRQSPRLLPGTPPA